MAIKLMTCLARVSWGGKICYGKSFQILLTKDGPVAVCEKCGKQHVIKEADLNV